MDAGALVVVVPTVDTVAEGIAGRDWTYFPPLGKRSQGGGQAFDPDMWCGVPGGYRNIISDNVVLIEMIETIEGVHNAREIAAIPGIIRSQRRPWQFFRLQAGLTLPAYAVVGVKGGWINVLHMYPSEMAQNFWTAIYAWSACFVVTVAVTLVTRPRPEQDLVGLVYSLTEHTVDREPLWYKRPAALAAVVLLIAFAMNIIFW